MNHSVVGIMSESLVEKALELLKSKSRMFPSPISNIVHAPKNSSLDRCGIDFVVEFGDGTKVNLQVKSSETRAQRFMRKVERLAMKIVVVVARVGDSIAVMINRVEKAIRLGLVQLERVRKNLVHKHGHRRPGIEPFRRFHSPCMCH